MPSKILFSKFQELCTYLYNFMLEIQRWDVDLHITLGRQRLIFQSIILLQLWYIKVCGWTLVIIPSLSILPHDVFKSLWAVNQVIAECVLACNFTFFSAPKAFYPNLWEYFVFLYSLEHLILLGGWQGLKSAHRCRDQGKGN